MRSVLNTIGYIFNHPLAGKHKPRALKNWVFWQITSRLKKGPTEVPFVGSTRLSVSKGMHGATGNIYCGLHEFEDMAFVLHFLRPSDVFVDIGANIGSYTILASGVCGARTIAVEPVLKTYAALQKNVELNSLQHLVQLELAVLGDVVGEARVSTSLDCTNHVVDELESIESECVQMATLDQLLLNKHPSLLKIDVEGFEMKVLNGGFKVLNDPLLLAVLMELNGSGKRYGVSDSELYQKMISFGFTSCRYHPMKRSIEQISESDYQEGNVLFLSNPQGAQERVRQADPFHVFGQAI